MQIPSIPPPLVTPLASQDAVAKVVPNLQATQPLMANAVNPAPKSEKSKESDRRKDAKEDQDEERRDAKDGKDDKRGGSVNIRV
ncbi:MAG: hypothetical protein KGI97_00275 [Alphaproteobacteria bacterium]|nr:hypothetical protein [Alphaproteobacteria bacterium]